MPTQPSERTVRTAGAWTWWVAFAVVCLALGALADGVAQAAVAGGIAGAVASFFDRSAT